MLCQTTQILAIYYNAAGMHTDLQLELKVPISY